MAEIIERYFADIDWPDGGTLLEIGCGTGPVARAAARHSPGTQVIGTDPAAELVEEARRRAKDIPNLRFEACGGANQPLLAEAFRVLRPGG